MGPLLFCSDFDWLHNGEPKQSFWLHVIEVSGPGLSVYRGEQAAWKRLAGTSGLVGPALARGGQELLFVFLD